VAVNSECVTPDHILDIGFAFRRSKALLSAVELDLFTVLSTGPQVCEPLASAIGIDLRGARDFFDALVSLKLLNRDAAGRYSNPADCARFLDRDSTDYIGGVLNHLNGRMYDIWGRLTPALRSGKPQSGALGTGGYEALYANESQFDLFLQAMTGGSLLPARMLAAKFPWHEYKTFLDVGTAQGCLPVEIARAHVHLIGSGFDLPAVGPAFARYVEAHGLSARLTFLPGNFLRDPLPDAEVLIFGRILHNWDAPTKRLLVSKAYGALPTGGALIVYDPMLDDARRLNGGGLFASLTMLLETAGGFEYGAAECRAWMRDVGFRDMRVTPLTADQSMVIGIK
jgi:hypothetical protein